MTYPRWSSYLRVAKNLSRRSLNDAILRELEIILMFLGHRGKQALLVKLARWRYDLEISKQRDAS